ncbi:MAG: virulence RhuM family protein [Syntrophobacteraceae bacterium]|jgi:hypothetical protein
MNIAKAIVDRFGGQTALAALLGKGQSMVGYWVKTGTIPGRWHGKLLSLAVERGIELRADDFILAPTPSIPRQQIESPERELNVLAPAQTNFMFYSSSDGSIKVQVVLGEETVWASQKGMAEIFDTSRENVTIHLKNIFESGELTESAVCKDFLLSGPDGKTYNYKMYNLDAIISIGYRVNSYRATQFRVWATTILKEFLIKGFALNDDRLKQGNGLFGKDYFDELLERIREIRASERRFYQKITDIYCQCSMDYDKDSPITQQFYAHVQDKLHYAIHRHTSAELIELRADATKPNMGLYSFKNMGKKGKITKLDVTVGKNYLNPEELEELNRLVSMYLDMAENFARRHKTMTMKDWAERLDGFLDFNTYEVLKNFGMVKRDAAERHALEEYEKFRVIQDLEFKSDFDEVVDEIKSKMRLPKKIE